MTKITLRLLNVGLALGLVTQIACGGGGGGGGSASSGSAVSGTVLEGAVKGATITAYDARGNVAATATSDATAKYTLAVPTGTTFPLEIVASGGTDVVTGETVKTNLSSLLTETTATTANVSTITTVITQSSKAKAGGDLTKVATADVAGIKSAVLKNFGFGIDGADAGVDPITTPLTESNIATSTKASEAMGEAIRRIAGTDATDQGKAFSAIAEDLADGNMDGKKAGESLRSALPTGLTTATFLATMNVQTAAVVAEVVRNQLQVTKSDGSRMSAGEVRSALTTSITTVKSDIDAVTAATSLANTQVSENLKSQGIAFAEAAQMLVGSSTDSPFASLASAFKNLVSGKAAAGQIAETVVQGQSDYAATVAGQIAQGKYSTATIEASLNRAPKAETGFFKTVAGVPVSGQLMAADHNGDNLTFALHTGQGGLNRGAVTITDASAGLFTYTPQADASGSDFFLFRANDGKADSNVAKVTIVIAESATADGRPMATALALETLPGTTMPGELEGFDPEGKPLTFQIVTQPTKGSVSLEDAATGYFVYTSVSTASGTDSFTYAVGDGAAISDTETVTITFRVVDSDDDGVADAADNCLMVENPGQTDTDGDRLGNACDGDDDGDGVLDPVDAVPLDKTESRDSDQDGIGDNADVDDDGDGVADSADALPLNAEESVDTDGDGIGNNADNDDDGDGTPDASDAFPLDRQESVDTDGDGIGNNTDTDDDGDGVADAVDSAPLVVDGARPLDTDGDGTVDELDADDDNDGVADVGDAFPRNPWESLDSDDDGIGNNGDGDDDGDGLPDTGDATPLGQNDAPVANSQAILLDEHGSYSGILGASDANRDALRFVLVTPATKGTVSLTQTTTGGFSYRPDPHATGSDSFAFKVNDGTTDSATATVTVTIREVNDAPTIADIGSQSVAQDGTTGPLTFTIGDEETVATQLTLAAVSSDTTLVPNAGILFGGTGANRTLTVTPSVGKSGSTTITVTVSDGTGSASDAFTVTVAAATTAGGVTASGSLWDTAQWDSGIWSEGAGENRATSEQGVVTLQAGDTAGVTHRWTQVAGTNVVLTGAETAQPSFTAPLILAPETLIFRLDSTYTNGNQTTDTVEVAVAPVPRTLTVGDVTLTEGQSGSTEARFAVTLSMASRQEIAVGYATADVTTTAGDFAATSGNVTFAPGVTERTIVVPVVSDREDELDETFRLVLSNPTTGVTLARAEATAIIVDDDTSSIWDTAQWDAGIWSEGAGSPRTTNEGEAVALGADPAATSFRWTQVGGTNVVLSGATSAAPTFAAPVVSAQEQLTFQVEVTYPGGVVITDRVSVTVNPVPRTLAINNVAITEGDGAGVEANFVVTLNLPSHQAVSVNAVTSDGTAKNGSDYTFSLGAITFSPGTTQRPMSVLILGDNLDEGNETFVVTIADPVNATLAGDSGTGTILDDDPGEGTLWDRGAWDGNSWL
ncbi:MAG: tandem-95 repeat protein [Magnetococcales bacterium]|nr:tandem-95 repeat protein [Magnetococcales bacterium]